MFGSRPRVGPHWVVRASVCAWAVAALGVPGGSFAQGAAAAKRDAPARAVAGSAVVSYEESPGTAILYLEQSGGLVSQAPPPIPRRIEPAPEPASRAVPPKVPATVADNADARNPRLASRETVEARAAAGKR